MKIVWLLLALLLTALCLGGIIAGLSGQNGGGVIDLIIAAFLGWAAWATWKRALAGRRAQPGADEPRRPWHR